MTFKESNLPRLIRSIHESQKKWRDKNWKNSLEKHRDEIEILLEKTRVFNKWRNQLQHIQAAKTLMSEIFIDAWVSIHLACFGLYRYANMCLRSELENVLRMIFFSTHPVEFKWWLQGDRWYRELRQPDVWGQSYYFFEHLDIIKRFEENCAKDKKKRLFKNNGIVKKLHTKLSKFIHSGPGYFQTRTDEIAPSYNLQRFKLSLIHI